MTKINKVDMRYTSIIFCCLYLVIGGEIHAQGGKAALDSVQTISQTTYEYNSSNKKYKTAFKESHFDTNGVMVRQDKYQYLMADTGEVVSSHYHLVYNPATYTGNTTMERFVTVRNKTYSKQTTKFKSFDHSDKRVSMQQYNAEGKLMQETENSYDDKKNLVRTFLRDHTYNPPLVQTDEITRNAAGEMIRWVSYDEDGGKKTQVRDYTWQYLYDTLIVKASGYIFNDWNETKNSYSKTGVITKSVQRFGTRQDNGKIKVNDQTITTYAYGKPATKIEYIGGKKSRTITYRHEAGFLEEIIESSEGKSVHSSKEIYQNNLLLERLKLVDDKPELTETFQYNAKGGLMRAVELEYKANGDEWKTELLYNERGNLIHRLFYIKKHLKQEDVYEYQHFSY